MKYLKSILALLAFSLGAQAGTSTFIGHGTSDPREPEFITVEIRVESDCYDSPSNAMKANNETTAQIQTFLNKFLSENTVDAIHIHGGTTAPSSHVNYENGERKPLCPNAFQQTTNITFKTSNTKEFSLIFASIQEEVLGHYIAASNSNAEPRTFASIGQPHAGVCQHTRDMMELEATQNAYGHARAQFDAVASMCQIQGDVEISSFGDVVHGSMSVKSMYAASTRSDSSVVSLSFEPIYESKSLSVSFSYDKTTFTCNNL